MPAATEFVIRLATQADIPALHTLIEQSIRGLQTNDYTPAQIDGALGHALGLDTQLVADQTTSSPDLPTPQAPGPDAVAGASARRSSAATTDPVELEKFSTPLQTPPKSAPSSSTPRLPAAAWVPSSSPIAKTPPPRPASAASKWAPPSPAFPSTVYVATATSASSTSRYPTVRYCQFCAWKSFPQASHRETLSHFGN